MRAPAELHCHTRFSDGAADPLACARAAARRGLRVLAITDHNTAEGGLAYWDQQPVEGVLVIPGEEVSTERGHLLVYFVRHTIAPGPFEQVVRAARAQGALCFMAHPCHIPLGSRWRRKPVKRLSPAELALLDGIEVENGHNRPAANRMAWELARRQGLRALAGSDAHYPWEIGNARTLLELEEITLPAVRAALSERPLEPLTRRWNSLLVYYWCGLLNRLAGRSYAYKETH